MKKLIAMVLLVCSIMLLACGCDLFTKEKTFSKSGMSITLTEDFVEKSRVSYTSTYDSEDIAVFTLKEEKELLGSLSLDLDGYTKKVIEVNGYSVDPKNKDGLTYFEYKNSSNGKDFHYYAFTYEADDAFWLVQFACEEDQHEKLEEKIFKYAKSVEV